MDNGTTYPSNVIYYNYTAMVPVDGNCEYKEIGSVGPVKEFGNMIFSIMTALAGLVGIYLSKNINISSQYMLSLIFGYGFMNAFYSATLFNGFLKTAQSILNLFQALIIVSLISSFKFPPFSVFRGHIKNILVLIAGFYPILTHTWASSSDSFWVGWLTYDLIWIIILIILILIFVFRKKYDCYASSPEIFSNAWLALASIILAYIFWLLDRFACSYAMACIYPLGWWYIFNAFGFYYMITLNACLQAGFQGYSVVVKRWPANCLHIFVFVSWITGDENSTIAVKEDEMHTTHLKQATNCFGN